MIGEAVGSDDSEGSCLDSEDGGCGGAMIGSPVRSEVSVASDRAEDVDSIVGSDWYKSDESVHEMAERGCPIFFFLSCSRNICSRISSLSTTLRFR